MWAKPAGMFRPGYNKPMMRFRALIFLAILAFSFVPIEASAAASFPIFDPEWHIVPDARELDPSCPAGAPLSFGATLQLIQNLMNGAVALTGLILIFVIVYAGALFMSSAANAEGISKAKTTFQNAAIGFIIVIAAWLAIDAFMKVLYVGDSGTNADFLPWNQVFTGGSACIKADPDQKPLFGDLNLGQIPEIIGGGGGTIGGPSAPLSTSGKGACNATTIAASAAAGGVRMSGTEANLLACLAGPESSCGAQLENYNWNAKQKPPPSTAYGPFQITLKGNSTCFENDACYRAANVSGPLNCSSAFDSKGYAIPGSTLDRCRTAAANLSCSSVAAHCVYERQGSSAWTQDKKSAQQEACISQTGG